MLRLVPESIPGMPIARCAKPGLSDLSMGRKKDPQSVIALGAIKAHQDCAFWGGFTLS